MDGQNSVLSVVGPLSHSIPSLRLMVKSILSQKPWLHDPLVHEIPWRGELEKQALDIIGSTQSDSGKLAFGILRHDGLVGTHPPVQRALDMMVKTLEKRGHKVQFSQPTRWIPCKLTICRSLIGAHPHMSAAWTSS